MVQPLASARCGRRARPRRRAGSRAWVAAVLATLAACAVLAPEAVADRSFTARVSATDRGQIVTAGNTVITCPGMSTSCKSAQVGTSSATNADFTMGYVDVDGSGSTLQLEPRDAHHPVGLDRAVRGAVLGGRHVGRQWWLGPDATGCADLDGETGSTYTATTADVGRVIV